MDSTVLFALGAVLLLLLLGVGALTMLKKADSEGAAAPQLPQPRRRAVAQAVEPDDEAEGEVAGAGGRRRGATDRMRAGALRQRLAARVAEQAAAAAAAAGGPAAGGGAVVPARGGAPQRRRGGSDSDSGSGSGSDMGDDGDEHMTRKERAKKERAEAREAARLAREGREGHTSAYDLRRAKRDAERDAQEQAQEDEIRRAEAERVAREDAEAAKWMGKMSVEAEGTGEAEASEEDAGLLGQFVDYIKANKTVPLDQLAIEFGMRTSEVIDRVHSLEAMGRLTGVMDERGKYIYISPEEMAAVAAYITSKGRVAIAELAARSNTFIDLQAKTAAAAVAAGSTRAATMDFDAILAA